MATVIYHNSGDRYQPLQPSSGRRQSDGRGSPRSSFDRRILKLDDERRASQYRPHDFTLKADTLAVNDANPSDAAAVSFIEVVLDYGLNLTRWNSVEVEHIAELD
jgi:hypothetical protein